jgi:hypothetical protein
LKKVQSYKDVEINERTFRIKKFDARTGSFMVFKITKILAPIVKNLNLNKLKDVKEASDVELDAFNLSGIMTELGNLSEDDFTYIQDKCLKVCSEVLPGGLAPVVDPQTGFFGVSDLEEDTMTVLALTAHAIIFNLQGFFQGSPLQKLFPGISTTSLQS